VGIDGEHRAAADRNQHTLLAAPVNLPTVLDLIADRETTTRQDSDRLREQITTLTGELARLDSELAQTYRWRIHAVVDLRIAGWHESARGRRTTPSR